MTEGTKIIKMFAFITTDGNDGDEGIIATITPSGMVAPMCGGDMDIIPRMKECADELGLNYQIKYFVEVPDAGNTNRSGTTLDHRN